jgi:hypothetical protein
MLIDIEVPPGGENSSIVKARSRLPISGLMLYFAYLLPFSSCSRNIDQTATEALTSG